MVSIIRSVISVLSLLLLFPEQGRCAPPPILGLPIKCIPGSTCFIQNYFDHDPSPGYLDYACGYLTNDEHHGTDFRLRDLAAMRTNVAVLAAAPGVVIGTRNTEPDISIRKRGTAALNGRDAGNGVHIDHGDGWATQYSHMLKGSVRVRVGQRVEKGEVLGFVGLSGNTEFPHLDFMVRKDGNPVDPFNPGQAACGTNPATLWSASAAQSLRYQASGLLISGFSTVTPERENAQEGGYMLSVFPADAENIFYWSEVFGLRKNDQLSVVLTGPDLKPVATLEEVIPGNKAIMYSFVGKSRGAEPWPKGTYNAQLRLIRSGAVIVEERRSITVK
jgi:hypothetical protein